MASGPVWWIKFNTGSGPVWSVWSILWKVFHNMESVHNLECIPINGKYSIIWSVSIKWKVSIIWKACLVLVVVGCCGVNYIQALAYMVDVYHVTGAIYQSSCRID